MENNIQDLIDYERAVNACNKRFRESSLIIIKEILELFNITIISEKEHKALEEYIKLKIKYYNLHNIPAFIKSSALSSTSLKQQKFLELLDNLNTDLVSNKIQKVITAKNGLGLYSKAYNLLKEETQESWNQLGKWQSLYDGYDEYSLLKLINDRQYTKDNAKNFDAYKESYDAHKSLKKLGSSKEKNNDITNTLANLEEHIEDKTKKEISEHLKTYKKIKYLYDCSITNCLFDIITDTLRFLAPDPAKKYLPEIKQYIHMKFIDSQNFVLCFFFTKLRSHSDRDKEIEAFIDMINYLEILYMMDKISRSNIADPQSKYKKAIQGIKKSSSIAFKAMDHNMKILYKNEDQYATFLLLTDIFAEPDSGWGNTIKTYISSVSSYFPSIPDLPSMDSIKKAGNVGLGALGLGLGTGAISTSGILSTGGSILAALSSPIALGVGGSLLTAKIAHYLLSNIIGSENKVSD